MIVIGPKIARWLAIVFVIALSGLSEAQAGDEARPGARPRLFNSLEFRGASLEALPQWLKVLAKISDERRIYAACDADITTCPYPAMAAWRAKIRALQGVEPQRQLQELNQFLNRWTFREDREAYGVEDYWAAPLEFLRQSGDCEDYAIAKYVSLRALGFSAESLRIVVVRDTLRNVVHAVVAVYLGEQIFVMDSLFDAVLPHELISFYAPQYSINETTRWAHVIPSAPLVTTEPGNILR